MGGFIITFSADFWGMIVQMSPYLLLGFLVDTHGLYVRVFFPYKPPLACEPVGNDRYAATRRAIVRAAAEIERTNAAITKKGGAA